MTPPRHGLPPRTGAAHPWPPGDGTGRRARGQVLALTAVVMLALLAMTAVVVDTGRIWMLRRSMQNSVDAAALAGAWELPDDTAGAVAVACDYATVKNSIDAMSGANCGGEADVAISSATFGATTVPNGKIKVTSRKQLVPALGQMFGWPTITVEATATAVIGSLKTVCAAPLYQTQDRLVASGAWQPDGNGNFVEFNVPVILKTNAEGSSSGNFLALQANGSNSKSAWEAMMKSPGGCQTTSESATTNTGNFDGPFNDAIFGRSQLWNNPSSPGYCPATAPTFNADGIPVFPVGHPLAGQVMTEQNCYRMIKIPILEGSSETINGSKTASIRGFLTFYMSNWCGRDSTPGLGTGGSQKCAAPAGTTLGILGRSELWGYYLKYEAVTDSPINPYDGLGTKVVLLVD